MNALRPDFCLFLSAHEANVRPVHNLPVAAGAQVERGLPDVLETFTRSVNEGQPAHALLQNSEAGAALDTILKQAAQELASPGPVLPAGSVHNGAKMLELFDGMLAVQLNHAGQGAGVLFVDTTPGKDGITYIVDTLGR